MIVKMKIYGKVQGIFFRKSAKIEAERLGITGWIKNLDDGTVETTVGGDQEKLKKFVAWCKKGPPFAKVENVEVAWSEDSPDGEGFEIVD